MKLGHSVFSSYSADFFPLIGTIYCPIYSALSTTDMLTSFFVISIVAFISDVALYTTHHVNPGMGIPDLACQVQLEGLSWPNRHPLAARGILL